MKEFSQRVDEHIDVKSAFKNATRTREKKKAALKARKDKKKGKKQQDNDLEKELQERAKIPFGEVKCVSFIFSKQKHRPSFPLFRKWPKKLDLKNKKSHRQKREFWKKKETEWLLIIDC